MIGIFFKIEDGKTDYKVSQVLIIVGDLIGTWRFTTVSSVCLKFFIVNFLRHTQVFETFCERF